MSPRVKPRPISRNAGCGNSGARRTTISLRLGNFHLCGKLVHIILCAAAPLTSVATYRFFNDRQLDRHFALHGAEFGVTDAHAYERMAEAFWNGPKLLHIHECTRQNGDTIRFDANADEYSVLDTNKVIRTYFKPVPCSSLGLADRALAIRTGKCHGESSRKYFSRSSRS